MIIVTGLKKWTNILANALSLILPQQPGQIKYINDTIAIYVACTALAIVAYFPGLFNYPVVVAVLFASGRSIAGKRRIYLYSKGSCTRC
jgi:hypothetical protein